MLMDALDKRSYCPRSYVVAATDRMSAGKALARETAWGTVSGIAPARLTARPPPCVCLDAYGCSRLDTHINSPPPLRVARGRMARTRACT